MNGNTPTYIREFHVDQGSTKNIPIDPNKLELIKSQKKLVLPIAVDFSFSISTTPVQTPGKSQAFYIFSLSLNFTGEVKSKKAINLATFNANKKNIELQFKSNISQYFQQNNFVSYNPITQKAVIGSDTNGYFTNTSISIDSNDPSTLICEFNNLPIPEKYSEYKDYKITGTLTATLKLTIKPQTLPPKTYIGTYSPSQCVQWYLENQGILPMNSPGLLTNANLNYLLFKHQQPNLNSQNIKFPVAQIAAGIISLAEITLTFSALNSLP